MANRLVIVVLSLALYAPATYAQTAMLGGTVSDERTGRPLAGAVIQVEGLERSALTNVDGEYRLPELPTGTFTVRVTYIGYTSGEESVTVSAGENTLNFPLEQDRIGLDALLVTAQQIERQAREVAYSLSVVRGEEMIRARETNFVSALAGRAPGVDVVTQSGNLGASTRIVIRGLSSLSGNNQPLFVVDGVPVSNANIVAGTSQDRLTGAIDVGNRGADINADDIESVTVLRGGAAAALYGQRAKDGVILITTRRGAQIAGQTVTANTSIRVSSPLVLPDFQNDYAQGSAGAYSPTSLNGWGPRISGQQVDNVFGETVTLRPFRNNVRDFYERGALLINSFSFAAADARSDFRLGITRHDETGIMPNSDLGRTSVNINTGYTLNPQLRARLSGVYTNLGSTGRAVAGGNDPNVLTAIVNSLPRTFDTKDLREYRDEQGNQRALGTFTNNPYWIANENVFSSGVERVFGNSTLEFDPIDWVTLTTRAGIDFYTENRQNINAIGTVDRENGLFSRDVIQQRQINVDVLAQAERDLSSDLRLSGALGVNINSAGTEIQRNVATDLHVPGLLNFANADANNPANSSARRRLMGVYADAMLGYRNYLFVNATGRNDWSTTLPADNNSFFYPSFNLSFVFTDAFDIASDVFSFGKLRANWSQVGSDEAPHQLAFTFAPVNAIFGQFGTGNNFPFGGRVGFDATNVIPPVDLKPQLQVEYEIGTELQFFRGRAGIDLTYYDRRTRDQILPIPIPQSTGFAAQRTNVGEVSNKGIEAVVNLNPVRTRWLDWDVDVNYQRNRNRVVSLAEDLDELVIASGFSSLQVKAEPGMSLGLYGPGWLRDEETGKPIIDPNTGLRQEGDIVRYGSIDPKFRLTLNNRIGIRNVSLSLLVDWRHGGSIFSNTIGSLRRSGLAAETALNRDGTFIDDGVLLNLDENGEPDGTTRPNDVPVLNMQQFWQRFAAPGIHESNVFDATNVRLRELRLSYALPRDWLGPLRVSGLSVGLEARNLFLLYKRIPHIDPETGLFGSASNGQAIEWFNLPSTRSFGANVQVRL